MTSILTIFSAPAVGNAVTTIINVSLTLVLQTLDA
jgi:hypothetical protein